jgi:hypothetical protein
MKYIILKLKKKKKEKKRKDYKEKLRWMGWEDHPDW